MLTCLQMLLEYRTGRYISIDRFRKALKHDDAVSNVEFIELAVQYGLHPLYCGLKLFCEMRRPAKIELLSDQCKHVFRTAEYFDKPLVALKRLNIFLSMGRPVIALLDTDESSAHHSHAVLILSMNDDSCTVIDPKIGQIVTMSKPDFLAKWEAYSCDAFVGLQPLKPQS